MSSTASSMPKSGSSGPTNPGFLPAEGRQGAIPACQIGWNLHSGCGWVGGQPSRAIAASYRIGWVASHRIIAQPSYAIAQGASVHTVHICLLTNQDLNDPELPKYDWPCDPRPHLPEADWHAVMLGEKAEAPREVRRLIRDGIDGRPIDVFFNLCDGGADQHDLPGVEVIRVLERAGAIFTGATSECFEPTRRQIKTACKRLGIATPRGMIVRTQADVRQAARKLRFPLFVKHHNSYASIDIRRRSKAISKSGLMIQAKKFIARHGAALIEEYIDGDECTVLVAENPRDPWNPIAYPPVKYTFPKGEHFKHEDLKWVTYQDLKTAPVTNTQLNGQLKWIGSELFVEMKAAGYARCDVRVDGDGIPHILEINANCGIFYPRDAYASADDCIALTPGGHPLFVRRLIAAARARQRRMALA